MTKRLQIGIIQVFLSLFGAFGIVAQSVPSLINYQGKLTDQNGNPLSAGVYGIQFRIWDSATAAGTNDLIWGQQQNATVQSNGVFNVILGSPGGSPISGATPAVNNLAYAFSGSNCFLGVEIVVSNGTAITSPSEILPRQQLLSVPFAVQAQTAFSLVTDLENALCPPATVVAYMGTNPPPGWLLCDGSDVSRTQYAGLFAVIGTECGAADGSTNFNLPDMRGLFLRGVNGSRSDAFSDPDNATLRTNIFTGGNASNSVGSYQTDMFRSHDHDNGSLTSGNVGFLSAYEPYGIASQGQYDCLSPVVGNWGNNPSDTGWTGQAGGNETRPKNIYVNYIIKY